MKSEVFSGHQRYVRNQQTSGNIQQYIVALKSISYKSYILSSTIKQSLRSHHQFLRISSMEKFIHQFSTANNVVLNNYILRNFDEKLNRFTNRS